jgi:hypothetical protein
MAASLSEIDLFGASGPKRKKRSGGRISSTAAASLVAAMGGAPADGGGSGGSSPLDPMVKKNVMGAVRSKGGLDAILASDAPDAVKEYARALYKGNQKKKPNTDKSLLHAVTHNPLTDVVGGALKVLPVGGRAVTATLDELNQRVDGYEDGSSWLSKVKDEHYGVGSWREAYAKEHPDHKLFSIFGHGGVEPTQAITPGSILGKNLPQLHADTALNLAGDIAFDPLSYVDAPVTTGVHGAEAVTRGEQALRFAEEAKIAAEAGDTARHAAMIAAADKVLKHGTMTAEELGQIGLERGLRFAGFNTGRGGAAVAKVVAPFNRVKQAGWNVGGNTFLSHFGADELSAARKAIHVGQDPMAAVEGLWVKNARSISKGQASVAEATRTEALGRISQESHAAGVDGGLIADALDGDTGAIGMLGAQHPGVLDKWREWTDLAHTQLGLGERKVEQYFPRVLNGEVDTEGAAFRKLFGSDRPSTHELTRLTVGDRFGEHILGSDELVKAYGPVVRHQMEGVWRELGNSTPLFVDNAYEALPRYSHSITKPIEQHLHDTYLMERGVIQDRPTVTQPIKGAAAAESKATRAEARAAGRVDKAAAKLDKLQLAQDELAPLNHRVENLKASIARVDEVAAQPHDPAAAKLLVAERKKYVSRLAEARAIQAEHEATVAKLEAELGRRAAAAEPMPDMLARGLEAERVGLLDDMAKAADEGASDATNRMFGAARTADDLGVEVGVAQQNVDAFAARFDEAAGPSGVSAVPTEAEVKAATKLLEDHLGVTEYNAAKRAKRATEGINYTPLDQISADTLQRNAEYAAASVVKAQREVDALQLAVENGGGAAAEAELRAAQVNLDTIQGVADTQSAAAAAARLLESVPKDDNKALLDALAERLDVAEMNLEDAQAAGKGILEARKELKAVKNELRRNGLPTDADALAAHIDEKLGGVQVEAVHMTDKPPFDPSGGSAALDAVKVFDWQGAKNGPVSDTYHPFEQMVQEWHDLGPDDPVRVYHGSDRPEAIRAINESKSVDLQGVDGHMRGTSDNRGIKDIGGLYVTLNPSLAGGYGDHVVSMVVPKRLIQPSSEVMWGSGLLKIPGVVVTDGDLRWYQLLTDAVEGDKALVGLLDGEGAVLPHGTPLADVTVHPTSAFSRSAARGELDLSGPGEPMLDAFKKGGDYRAAGAAHVAGLQAEADAAVVRMHQAEGLARHLGTSAHKYRITLGDLIAESSAKLMEASPAVRKAAEAYDELRPVLDQALEAQAIVGGDGRVAVAALDARIGELDRAIVGAKNPARAAQLKEAKAARTTAKAALERSLGEDSPTVKFVLGLDAAASEAQAQLLESVDAWRKADTALGHAQAAPKFQEVLVKELERSKAIWPKDETKMWPQWMQDASEQLIPVARSNKLLGAMDWFNKAFKAQATLSPGFHVRNAYSAVFMNMVHGVTFAEMKQWHAALTAYRTGGIEAVEASMQPFMQQVVDAGFLTTGTRWSHELSAMGDGRLAAHAGDMSAVHPTSTWESVKAEARGTKLSLREPGDNPVNRLSNLAGVRVEQFARSVLAFHDLKAGMSLETAWERVAHVHFDYTDLSSLESNVLKRIIPFWTWTSRNLPLQVESIITKPKWYNRFLTVKRNVELAAGPMDPLTPMWLQDNPGAVRVGADQWLTPDLPFVGAQELSSSLRDQGPLGVMQDVAPILRLPFEAKAGRQSFGDIPLSDKPVKLPTAWLPLVPAIKAATGDSVVFKKDGDWVIAGKQAYMMESMFPLLGRARRLAPNDPKYQERAVQSWLGFMGFGTRRVTQRDREAVSFQISDQLKNQLKWLENHGYDTRSASQRHKDYTAAQQRKARGQ